MRTWTASCQSDYGLKWKLTWLIVSIVVAKQLAGKPALVGCDRRFPSKLRL